MTIISRLTIKTAVSAGLAVTLLGTTVGCTVASGYDTQPVYRDSAISHASYQLRQDLRRSGYDVINIRSDDYRGRQIFVVHAKKKNQLYELRYTYPDLKRISSVKRDWSNDWQNNNNHQKNKNKQHGNGHYKNKGEKRSHYIDNKTSNEARYSVIRQRAIRKVNAMGYQVTDIEFEEKKKRGIFEIEARRGSQDYEIELSYPSLDVLKIKKD